MASFPFITTITAGILLVLQILLAMTVSIGRGKFKTPIGDGNHATMHRLTRRHANIAENAGIFIGGFTLLELSGLHPKLLVGLCAVFIIARLFHAIGLSQENTENMFRILGAVGTYLSGLTLGITLIIVGWPMLMAAS